MKKSLFRRLLMTLTLLFVAMSAASAADRFYIDAVNIEAGETRTLAFILDNDQEFYGFQADLKLPEGLEIVTNNGKPDITLSSRADASYTIVSNLLADGNVRLGTFSTNHTALTGNSGVLLYVKVKADSHFVGGTLAMTKIIFIGANDQDVELADYTIQLGTVHNNSFYIPDFKIAVGETKTISVILDNETLFTAFQTDVYLPEGLNIVSNSLKLTSRGSSNHTISAKSFSDGRTRIACFSTGNNLFKDNSGDLLQFDITAAKDVAETCVIELKNQIFTMANAKEYILPNSITNVTTERALVTDITVDPGSIRLVEGDSRVLTALVSPTYASTKDVEWSSENPEIASVSQAGVVTAVGIGKTEIRATAIDGSGIYGTCTVEIVGRPVAGITINRTSVSLKATETFALSATVSPDNATDKSLTWSSGDREIATVDENGNVTAISIGETTITATSVSNPEITAQCVITVVPTPVSSIILTPTSVSLKIGGTADISAEILPETATEKCLAWTSTNNSIVTVDETGHITALAIGTTQIRATAIDGSGMFAVCEVNVVPTPAESISIATPDRTEFKVGETIDLTATVLPEDATDKSIFWTSSNPGVVSISADGVATAMKVGEAVITAHDSANHSADITLTVIPTLAESISIIPQNITLRVGSQATLLPTVIPSTTTNPTVEWEIDNQDVASIKNGVVTAKSIGSAVISAKTADGSDLTATATLTVEPTPAESISIEPKGPFTFKVGETVQLSATVLPETTTDKSVSWLAQTPAVSVDKNGLVTALCVGNSRVIATNSAGQSAYVDFTVVPTRVIAITLSSASVQLKANETVKLEAQVEPAEATDKSLTWTSSNPAAATVDVNGNVMAVAVGEADIIATANDGSGVVATCKVTVVQTPVESISVTANGSTMLKAGQTVQLSATVLPETATDKTVVWSSSDTGIATVNESGLVTAVSVGNASITATAGDKSASLVISVEKTLAEAISLNRTTAAMKVSGTMQLSAIFTPETTTDKSVDWVSSDPTIASVNENGLVTAHALGNCRITATAADGSNVSAYCDINVGETAAESISIEPKGPFTFKVGETVQLSATVMPETTTDKSVSWLAQTGAVSVDENGLVTALAVGTSRVSATNSAGQEAYVNFTVVPTPVTSINLNSSSVQLKVNDTISLQAQVEPADATDKSLTWTSSNPAVATVDVNGNITAVAVGEANITATANDGSGVFATCKVTVVPIPVESVTVTADGSTTLKIGQTVQLNATVLPETASDKSIVWNSSNRTVASVNESGLVTAVSPGNTSITASAGDKSASVEITVDPILVESLSLTHTDIDLKVGEEYTLFAAIIPFNATNKTLAWKSDDESIASVNSEGTVHANSIGNTVVRVFTTDGTELTSEARIYVHPTPISQIIVDYDGPTTLKVGETAQLSARVFPESATDKSIRWKVMNPAILNISENGLVTAVGIGNSWAGAFANNESEYPYDVVEFTVAGTPIERIDFEQDYIIVRTGEQAQINAIVYPSTATNKDLTWDSNDSNIATVDNNGVVTGIAPGQVDINVRATDGSGVFNAIRVKVDEMPVASISIEANGSTLLKDGESVQLLANISPTDAYNKSIIWTSSDNEIATVSEEGIVTAHSELGQVVITATASNGVKGTIIVEVVETPVQAIDLQGNSEMKVGDITEIRAVIFPETATNKSVTWSVEKPDILNIQGNVNNTDFITVEALQPGESTVSATSVGGVVGSYLIKVNPILAESISINSNSARLNVSETFKLNVKVLPENASDKSITWISKNPQTVTVDDNGLLTAIAPGSTDITAYTNDGSGLSANCQVEVVQPVTAISLSEHDLELKPNSTFTLIATIEPIDASDKSVSWSSHNTDVAAVDDRGIITTFEEGASIVSVKTLDGSNLTDICWVTVKKNAGVETISMDDVDIKINDNHVIVSGLRNESVARLYALDGKLLNSAVSDGSDIIFDILPNTYYILNIGKFSLKLISK